VSLRLGSSSESVTVNAELTGVEANQSVMGQLMSAKQIEDLPLNGRNVFILLELSAGVINTTQVWGSSGTTSSNAWGMSNGPYKIQGSFASTNAFMLDGAPILDNGSANYVPNADGVAEFKVNSFANDASLGLTGGGTINVTMKSGTNQYHGLLSEFFRNNIFDANFTQSNAAGLNSLQHQYNDYSAMLGGPIIKNKIFFFGLYEGFRDRPPFATTDTFPTVPQRVGDFSQTFNGSGQLITIYDPLSTQASGSNYVRTAFPGNGIPASRISPIALNMLKYVPLANVVTNPITNANNYAASPNDGWYPYDSYHVKFDYLWNDKQRTTATLNQLWATEWRSQNGLPLGDPARFGPDPNARANFASSLDHVWNLNPTTVIDARASWNRLFAARELTTMDSFNGNTLGFQGQIGADPINRYPSLTFTNYTAVGPNVSRNFSADNFYSAVADISKVAGRHYLKFGVRITDERYNAQDTGFLDPTFGFTPAWTQRNPLSADSTSGNAIASYLLGYPASGDTDVNPAFSYAHKNIGLYFQDDFKVTHKLVLNLGLRWDLQTPSTERYNRIIEGFNPTVSSPLGAGQAVGGVFFAGGNNQESWKTDYTAFQPRFGFAYQVNSKLVVRAGYGLSYLPVYGNINGNTGGGPKDVYTTGYARSTAFVATLGGGLNSYIPGLPGTGTLANPFPGGFLQPFGNTLGPLTGVGQGITSVDPDTVVPRVHQFYAGVDYELPDKITASVSYVGSRTHDYWVTQNVDAITLAQRLQGVANPAYLNAAVPNPFAGASLLAGTSLSGATITEGQALLPYPQFTGVTDAGVPVGGASYNALEVRVNKRLGHGLLWTADYTWSKTLQWTAFQAAQFSGPEHVISPDDRSRHLTFNVVYELPFGRGKQFQLGKSRILDAVVGNWQYNIVVEMLTGSPTPMPTNATAVRDPKLPSGQQTFAHWFDTCTLLTNGQRSGCSSASAPITWVQYAPNQLPTSSSYMPNVRNPYATRIDMSLFKSFPIRDRVTVEFRGESFNTTNTPIYPGPVVDVTSPNFGVVLKSQQNFPRDMQFSLRIRF
jgi:hypothetical protein